VLTRERTLAALKDYALDKKKLDGVFVRMSAGCYTLAQSQRDLLGDAGTTPVEIAPFQFNDCVDEFSLRSFRARRTPALARKQHAVLSFGQHVVEVQQRGWLQDDGGTQNACRAHEKGAQTGDETLCGAQVGSTLAGAIEDAELMFDEQRFGNDGTEPSRPCKPDDGDNQMKEKDDDIAHPGMVSKPQKTPNFGPIR